MMILSYFPPTNEEMAMAQLGASPKEIKKLKQKGTLKYQGRLICNRSIDEYLKGGKGYTDALRLSLRNAIDESNANKYAQQKILKNADIQLATLVEKDLVKVTFKNQQKSSLSNFYMIEKVEWTDKIQAEVKHTVDAFYKQFIGFIAHKRNSSSFGLCSISDSLRGMKKLGAVNMCLKYIDELIESKLLEHKIALDEFNTYDSSERSILERLIVLKKKHIDNKQFIKIGLAVEKYKAENEKLQSEQNVIKQANMDKFSHYIELITSLEIKYEINLLTQLKNKLSNKTPYGYDNFVEDFRTQTFDLNNQVVSLDEITEVVNSTRTQFKKAPLATEDEIVSELIEAISWDFRTQ